MPEVGGLRASHWAAHPSPQPTGEGRGAWGGACSAVIPKGYQPSVTGLLYFQLLLLLPFSFSRLFYCWSSLDFQSSREETRTTFSVSPSGNSTYILNPFRSDYNTYCCTTFGNYRNIGIRKYKPQLKQKSKKQKQNRSQKRMEVWGGLLPATGAWLAVRFDSGH